MRCLIQQEPVVLRCVFLERLTSDSDKFFGLSECWRCEHGVMIFVLGNYTKEGRFGGLTLDCKKKWGSFALIHPVANRFLKECLPKGFAKAEICIITLSKLSDTRRVRDCLARGFKDFEEGEDFFLHLSKALNGMNAELQRWSKSTKGNLAGAFDWNRKDQSDLFVSAAKAIVRLTESADK